MNNYYQILNVPCSASIDDISYAYRRLAMIRHPDRGGSKEMFQELQEAYENLKDPTLRMQHDEKLANEAFKFDNVFVSESSKGGIEDLSMLSDRLFSTASNSKAPNWLRTLSGIGWLLTIAKRANS